MQILKDIILHEKYQSLDPLSPEQVAWKVLGNNYPRYTIMTGGRGSGKSFALALFIAQLMEDEPGQVIVYTRRTMLSAHKSIIPEFMEKLELLGMADQVTATKDQIIHNNGSIIWFLGLQASSGQNTARLKSIQNLSTWVLDEAEELHDEDLFDTIDQSIRTTSLVNRVVLSLNPTSVDHFLYQMFYKNKGVEEGHNGIVGDVNYIHTTYEDMLDLEKATGESYLNETWINRAEETKRLNLLRYNNKFLGIWLTDTEGALWSFSMIHNAQKKTYDKDDIQKVVISVDPSVSSTGKQDVCGIMACAALKNNQFVILEDVSDVLSPEQWAAKVIKLYHKYDANFVVAEVNQGGDLVSGTIENANIGGPPVKIVKVRATKGKMVRAEPISVLYEKNLVSHNSGLKELELEMRTYTGNTKQESPGRLDALVWGLHYLSKRRRIPYVTSNR